MSAQKQKAKAEDVVESDHEELSVTDDETLDITSPSTSSKKKQKKRSKVAKALDSLRGKSEIPQEVVDRVLDKVKAENAPGSSEANPETVRQILEQLKIMDVIKGKAGVGGINRKDMGEHKVCPSVHWARAWTHLYKFWATQPVPQPGEGPSPEDGYIEPSKPREEVRQEPYPLPKDFEWTTLDIDDPKQVPTNSIYRPVSHPLNNTNQIKEVYDLLSLNYVEDDDAAFRFQYSAEFLTW